jgi:hypothetical protein
MMSLNKKGLVNILNSKPKEPIGIVRIIPQNKRMIKNIKSLYLFFVVGKI